MRRDEKHREGCDCPEHVNGIRFGQGLLLTLVILFVIFLAAMSL